MENECMHIKSELRTAVLKKRNAMPAERRTAASHDICAQLENLFGNAPRETFMVAVYSPMNSEVDISEFTGWLYANGARVAFPCMNKKGTAPRMHMREVGAAACRAAEQSAAKQSNTDKCAVRQHKTSTYVAGQHGAHLQTTEQEGIAAPFIAKPIKRFSEDDAALDDFPIVPPKSIDAIVVPMVAFDGAFRRLGYGGGNYDEYLELLSREARIVGVAFEEQRIPRVPTEPHDLPLPTIISA